MVMSDSPSAGEVARLEARVARLEKLLADRSRVLRSLARGLCEEDLVTLSRLESGLPPLLRSDAGSLVWRDTTRLTTADVERTMTALWRAVAPFHGADED
ncbi:MAG TPA: hypothetical protein VKE50_01135 [Thermoanaerobaculia bacterium]|nr:hypothetical protein [Thermoanaerobaculia bacterium]